MLGRVFSLLIGLAILFATEILRVYFIMPFPGSQQANTIDIAYFIDRYALWLRILGLLLVIFPAIYLFQHSARWKKLFFSLVFAGYILVFYFFNYRFSADRMFYQPGHKVLVSSADNKVDTNKLVIGTVINGEARAYPIEIIGYHHQVQDTIGGQPIMVTYCTVCRTGAIYSPFFNKSIQHFRLVGMDHFNAMFEDEGTKTWWRQAAGEAIAGPLKGKKLDELPSFQMRLAAWLREYPNTLILQPDMKFKTEYDDLAGYDNGTIKDGLEKRDSGSWHRKSWVVGITSQHLSRAYDWNDLQKCKLINDTLGSIPVLIVLEDDSVTFHVFDRIVNGNALQFCWNDSLKVLEDNNTRSRWAWNGLCVDGPLRNSQLTTLNAYQQFWHSWQTFHPLTGVYGGPH